LKPLRVKNILSPYLITKKREKDATFTKEDPFLQQPTIHTALKKYILKSFEGYQGVGLGRDELCLINTSNIL